MDIDQKVLSDLAKQMGMGDRESGAAEKMADMAKQYKNKSEDELLNEILLLKQEIKSEPAQYAKQINAVRALAGMMGGEQRQRLNRVIALLENDD